MPFGHADDAVVKVETTLQVRPRLGVPPGSRSRASIFIVLIADLISGIFEKSLSAVSASPAWRMSSIRCAAVPRFKVKALKRSIAAPA